MNDSERIKMRKAIFLSLVTLLQATLSACPGPADAPGSKPVTSVPSGPVSNQGPSGTGNSSSGGQTPFAENELTVNKAEQLQPLSLEKNMARLPGAKVNVSSTYEGWEKERLIDGDLGTSWFTAVGDAANLGKS